MNEFRGSSGAPATRMSATAQSSGGRRQRANAQELRDVERAGATTHNMKRVGGHAGLGRQAGLVVGLAGRTDAHLDVVDRNVELQELSHTTAQRSDDRPVCAGHTVKPSAAFRLYDRVQRCFQPPALMAHTQPTGDGTAVLGARLLAYPHLPQDPPTPAPQDPPTSAPGPVS
jgi:hypothetical protein